MGKSIITSKEGEKGASRKEVLGTHPSDLAKRLGFEELSEMEQAK